MTASKCAVPKTPEARFRHLREQGPKLLINLDSGEPGKPQWLDETRWAEARAAVDKFYIGLQYSSVTGLLLILQLPDGLEPLLSTGNSRNVPALFRRYLSTIQHVMFWYEDDVFDPSTKGYKSIRQVRSMHKRLQANMNSKFATSDLNGDPNRRWFNQYDVALTQFAFLGLAMLYPIKSAMIAASERELEALNYYWRVLGHLMGIEDEFNLCQFDSYADILQFYKLVFEHEYLDVFKQFECDKGVQMSKAIILALQNYAPLLTFNILAHWWSDCFKFNRYEPQPPTMFESFALWWTRVSFNKFFKSQSFLKFANKLQRRRFQRRLKDKDKVYEKLKKEYEEDPKYQFYSDRVDYFASDEKQVASDQGVTATTNGLSNETNNNNNNNNSNHAQTQTCGKANIDLVAVDGGICPFGFSKPPMVIIEDTNNNNRCQATV